MTRPVRRVRYSEDPAEWRRDYQRDYRAGKRRTNGKRPVLLRILDKLDRDPGELVRPELGPCWVWRGARNSDGYGVVRGDDNKLALVHRIALAAALGRPLAPGMVAAHRCDHRRCARPRHLYEGTQSQNVHDIWDRDRRSPATGASA